MKKTRKKNRKKVTKKSSLKKTVINNGFIKNKTEILHSAHTTVTAALEKENEKQKLIKELLQKRKRDLLLRERKKTNKSITYKKTTIPFEVLQKSLDFLNDDNVITNVKFPEKCKQKIHLLNKSTTYQYALNSFTTICAEMHKCLLIHDWASVTKCIIALADGPSVFQPVVWKAAFINLLHNPLTRNSGLIEDFLRKCVCCTSDIDMEAFLLKIFTLPEKKLVRNKLGLAGKLLQTPKLTEVEALEE